MKMQSRRLFIKTTGLTAAAASLSGNTEVMSKPNSLNLGMASYTTRKFSLDETIVMTKRLGLSHIALKSFHLPLDSSDAQIKTAAQKVRDAGLDLYGCGVVYMKTADEVDQAFNYAAVGEMRIIIGAPNYELLGIVEDKVKSYDIMVAIHNHGPDNNLFPSPTDVYDKVKNLDKRIGLCMDIGHTKRLNQDPSALAKKYSGRLLDIHIKDVSAASKEGSTVEIGRGVIDIPRFLKTVINSGYKGTAAFEFEKDENDPMPGLAESVGYVRGALATLLK